MLNDIGAVQVIKDIIKNENIVHIELQNNHITGEGMS